MEAPAALPLEGAQRPVDNSFGQMDILRTEQLPPLQNDFDEGEENDDNDDKQKVSRWQIGSGSLGVLEQVYAMEPFPGTNIPRTGPTLNLPAASISRLRRIVGARPALHTCILRLTATSLSATSCPCDATHADSRVSQLSYLIIHTPPTPARTLHLASLAVHVPTLPPPPLRHPNTHVHLPLARPTRVTPRDCPAPACVDACDIFLPQGSIRGVSSAASSTSQPGRCRSGSKTSGSVSASCHVPRGC